MRVLVNALSVAPGGGATLARFLVSELAQLDERDEYVVLVKDNLLAESDSWPPNVRFVSGGRLAASGWSRVIWEQVGLVRLLRAERCDLLFGLGGFGVTVDRCAQVVVAQNAYFYASRPWMSWKSRMRLRAQRLLQLASIRAGARVVCVSDYMYDLLSEHVGDRIDHLDVVLHGTDMIGPGSEVTPQANEGESAQLSVLWVGVARSHKNLDDMLAALPRVEHEAGQPVDLRIAGAFSDSDQAEASRLASEAGHSGPLTFLGHLDRESLQSEYQRATAYVSTSRLESSDMGVLEAMASGTPVVGTDIPVREPMRACMRLYTAGDIDELSNVLSDVLLNPSEKRRLGSLGQAYAASMSWRRTAEQYRSVFHRAIDERQGK